MQRRLSGRMHFVGCVGVVGDDCAILPCFRIQYNTIVINVSVWVNSCFSVNNFFYKYKGLIVLIKDFVNPILKTIQNNRKSLINVTVFWLKKLLLICMVLTDVKTTKSCNHFIYRVTQNGGNF